MIILIIPSWSLGKLFVYINFQSRFSRMYTKTCYHPKLLKNCKYRTENKFHEIDSVFFFIYLINI